MSHRCNSFPYSDWLLCILPCWSLLMLSRQIGAQVGRTRAVWHMARALGRASIAELVASVDVETGWLQSDMDDWLLCGLFDVAWNEQHHCPTSPSRFGANFSHQSRCRRRVVVLDRFWLDPAALACGLSPFRKAADWICCAFAFGTPNSSRAASRS